MSAPERFPLSEHLGAALSARMVYNLRVSNYERDVREREAARAKAMDTYEKGAKELRAAYGAAREEYETRDRTSRLLARPVFFDWCFQFCKDNKDPEASLAALHDADRETLKAFRHVEKTNAACLKHKVDVDEYDTVQYPGGSAGPFVREKRKLLETFQTGLEQALAEVKRARVREEEEAEKE